MTNTSNYELKKPAQNDYYNVQDQNDNMEVIDSALKTISDNAAAAKVTANAAIPASEKGAASGVATLDTYKKLTSEQLYRTVQEITESSVLTWGRGGKFCPVNSAADVVITIPANATTAFSVGTEIEFCRLGAGAVTFAAAAGVTLNSIRNTTSINDRYGSVFLKQTAANVWMLRDIAPASHNHEAGDITNGGAGSGLDADMVDGLHSISLMRNLGTCSSDLFEWLDALPSGTIGSFFVTTTATNVPALGFTYTGIILCNLGDGTKEVCLYRRAAPFTQYRAVKSTTWGAWKNLADGGNAATLASKQPYEYMQFLGICTSTSLFTWIDTFAVGTVGLFTAQITATGVPVAGATYNGVLFYNAATDGKAMFLVNRNGGKLYTCIKSGSGWSSWTNISDGGDADKVDGKHAADFAPNTFGVVTGTDLFAWAIAQTQSGSFLVPPTVTANIPDITTYYFGRVDLCGGTGANTDRSMTLIAADGRIFTCVTSSQVFTTWQCAAILDSYGKVKAEQASSQVVWKEGSHTLDLTEAGKFIVMGNTTATATVTIPAAETVNFPIGTELEILIVGGHAVIITPASGVNLLCNIDSSNSSRTITDLYGVACLKKINAAGWLITGDLE